MGKLFLSLAEDAEEFGVLLIGVLAKNVEETWVKDWK